jgi:hypothetical protein
MNHRGVRLTVWLLACVAVLLCAFGLFSLERRIRTDRDAARAVEGEALEAALLVERVRAAQQSYLAEGQGQDFWMGRVTEIASALEHSLATLHGSVTDEGARAAVRSAVSALADYERMDRRARGYLESKQALMASDLIFTDSLGATTALALSIEKARTEQQAASDARIREIEQRQAWMLAGTAALTLVLSLLLMPQSRRETPQDTREALRALIADSPTAAGPARPDAHRPASASPPERPAPAPAAAAAPEPVAPAPPVQPALPAPDLAATALVCSELARLQNPADLEMLLARASMLLDASGVIVWVADRSGSALFPAIAHGYSPSLMARMTSIPKDADNAAAAAWRSATFRTVPALDQAPGALVMPIVTPDGCVGVLAAETRHGAEAQESTRAVAAIIAAQLATLVTTLPGTEPVTPDGDSGSG